MFPGDRVVKGTELFHIFVKFQHGDKSTIRVEFTDVSTSQQCELGFVGNWEQRDDFFWLDRGHRGVDEPVVKIYCAPEKSRRNYHLEIASNVKQLMSVFLCRAVDFFMYLNNLRENNSD